jgi:hypothetical protein
LVEAVDGVPTELASESESLGDMKISFGSADGSSSSSGSAGSAGWSVRQAWMALHVFLLFCTLELSSLNEFKRDAVSTLGISSN